MIRKKIRGWEFIILTSVIMIITLSVLDYSDSNKAFAQSTQQDLTDSIRFFNINMPATATVGNDFTLTGTIVVDSSQTLDHVYLTIQNSGKLWIYGDQTVDLGYFVGGVTQKNFSFKIRPLQSGSEQITLSAIGTQNNYGVQMKGSVSINSTAASTLNATQEGSQLVFTKMNIPQDMSSGHEAIITYTFVNKGSFVANDVIVTMTTPSGVLVKGEAVNNIGKLFPSQSVSSTFKVVPIDSGSFKLNLTAYSSNNPTSSLPITLTVADSTAGLALTSTTTSPSNFYPGDVSDKLNIGISNFGQEDLHDVTLNLVLPDGMTFATSGYNSRVFNYLPSAKNYPYDVQQIGSFNINIDKTISPGTHIIGLLFNGNNLLNYSIPLPIMVSPKAVFELQNVTYSSTTLLGTQSQTSLSPGVTTVVRVTLKNTGSAPAESVVGTLLVSNDFQGIKNTGVINVGVLDRAGEILPNQVFHMTFTLDVDPTSQSGTYPGTISLAWQQEQLLDNFSQSVPMTIQVTPTPIIYSIPYIQLFLGGTSALFLVLYLVARRKIKKDEAKKTPI